MATEASFKEFLSNIEPSNSTVTYISSIQRNIREFLLKDSSYKDVYVDSFLSGSYAKKTSIRPKVGSNRRDVDIIIITNYSISDNSVDVIKELYDLFKNNKKYNNVRKQKRSVSVEMNEISIDIVPVIKKSDSEIYKIGNSEKYEWIDTNPKCHIEWSSERNKETDNKYKKIIKILKWWNQTNQILNIKFPKGISLEKLISDCFGDFNTPMEDLLISTIKNINKMLNNYLQLNIVPTIEDPCLSGNDLFEKYSINDLKRYINLLKNHLEYLELEEYSNEAWRSVLGKEFPKDKTKESSEEFIDNHYNIDLKYNLGIDCEVKQDGWRTFKLLDYLRTGGVLRENKKLKFYIENNDTPKPFKIFWKVRNVGPIAINRSMIRGQIIKSNNETLNENTNFSGPHYVECYIIKDNICVARARIDVPIVSVN